MRLNHRSASGLMIAMAIPDTIKTSPVGTGNGKVSKPSTKRTIPIGIAIQRIIVRFDFL
ncbi:hypothetical protein [Kordiimonas aquimaris]|uniref:hypothetical protein n=1 Tax=Kordiimonas aquimaris TaxID=707591 RepID=UPI0021D10F92|nr:hypothetical protein [Kordiimonas aquimaris]